MSKLLVERQDAVTVLTLNRPEVHNNVDDETGHAARRRHRRLRRGRRGQGTRHHGRRGPHVLRGRQPQGHGRAVPAPPHVRRGPDGLRPARPRQAGDRGHQRRLLRGRGRARRVVRLPHRRRAREVRPAQQALGPLARRRRHPAAAARRRHRQRPLHDRDRRRDRRRPRAGHGARAGGGARGHGRRPARSSWPTTSRATPRAASAPTARPRSPRSAFPFRTASTWRSSCATPRRWPRRPWRACSASPRAAGPSRRGRCRWRSLDEALRRRRAALPPAAHAVPHGRHVRRALQRRLLHRPLRPGLVLLRRPSAAPERQRDRRLGVGRARQPPDRGARLAGAAAALRRAGRRPGAAHDRRADAARCASRSRTTRRASSWTSTSPRRARRSSRTATST